MSSSIFRPYSPMPALKSNVKSDVLGISNFGASNAPGIGAPELLVEVEGFVFLAVVTEAGTGIPDVGVLGPTPLSEGYSSCSFFIGESISREG